MLNTYHILNGDALLQQFPNSIPGARIVARACLVDGPVNAHSLQQLYAIRAQFISENYGGFSIADYYRMSVAGFSGIQNIPEGSAVCLWFEDDLFCQVNCWFILHLLLESKLEYSIYLIRPQQHTRYGFGGLTAEELAVLYNHRQPLKQLEDWAQLWPLYTNQSINDLLDVSREFTSNYPFVEDAVNAHVLRLPTENSQGRPKELLLEIMKELDTDQFGPVFNAFCTRAPIYGFGDLQVKRLLEELNTAGNE